MAQRSCVPDPACSTADEEQIAVRSGVNVGSVAAMAEHRENGRRSRGDDSLSGCYLLIVVGEPTSAEHREVILQKITKGFLSWDMEATGCCISAELQYLVDQDPLPEEAKNGEKLIQFVSENLVTEVLINPQVNTLQQCMKNLLSSYTKHKHVIHAGYAFSGSGSWILQDSTYSFADFLEAFQDAEVNRIFKAYENCISIHVHCAPEGDWTTAQLNKEPFAKLVKVAINPDDRLSKLNGVANFVSFLHRHIIAQPLADLLEPSDVVGNIRFSRPTLYVFPGGQGDSALFGVNGFNMLIDGGFNRKACFWDFARHLDRVDALLVTQISNSNLNGVSAFLKRKVMGQVYPKIGHVFCNIMDRKHSPDGDKDTDSLLVSLAEEGHLMMENLRHLGLKPQNCYREPVVEPINLYHKVGHGNLDMYVLNPAKDSKEVKEFLQQWHSQSSAFGASRIGMKIADKELLFPLPNLMSICAILVWQPADPTDSITRILFPGSSPQSKIFEGLDKLRHLEILKTPVCSEKSLQSTTVIKTKSRSQVGDVKPIRLSAAKLAAVNKSEDKPEIIAKVAQHTKAEKKHELKTVGKVEDKKVTEVKPSPKIEEKKAETKPIPKPDVRKQETKKSSPMIVPAEKKSEPKKVVQMVGGKLIEMPKTTNGTAKSGPTRHGPSDNGKSAPKAKGVKEATNKKAAEEKNIAMKASATAKKEIVKKSSAKKPSSSSVKRPSTALSAKAATGTGSPTPSFDLENKKVSSSSATSVASSIDTNKAEAPTLIDEISPTNEVLEGDGHLAAQDSAEEEKTSVDEKQSLDEEMKAEKDSIKLANEEFLVEERTEKEKVTEAMKLEDEEHDNKILSSLATSEQAGLEADSKNNVIEISKIDNELKGTAVDYDLEAQHEDVESEFVMPERQEALVKAENLINEDDQALIGEPAVEEASKFEISGKLPEAASKQLEVGSVEEGTVREEDVGHPLAKEIEELPAKQMAETGLRESRLEKLDFQEQDTIVNKESPYEPLDTAPPTADVMGTIDKDHKLESQEWHRDEKAQEIAETVEEAPVKEMHVKEQDSKVEKYVEDITQTAIKQVVSEPEHVETKVEGRPAQEDHHFDVLKDNSDFKSQESLEEIQKDARDSENVTPVSKSPEVREDLQQEADFDFGSVHPTESWQKQHFDRPKEDAGETFLDPSKVHIIFTAASSEEATDEYRLDERAIGEPVKAEKVEKASSPKGSTEDVHAPPVQKPTDAAELVEAIHDQHVEKSTDGAEQMEKIHDEYSQQSTDADIEMIHDLHEQLAAGDKIAQDFVSEVQSSTTGSKVQEPSIPSHEAKVEVPVEEHEVDKYATGSGHPKEDIEERLERLESQEPKGTEEKIPPSSPVEKYIDHGRIPIAEETGSKLTGVTDKDFKAAAVILSPIPEDAPKMAKMGEASAPLVSSEVHREVRLQQESQECLRTPDEVADLPIHEEVPTEFEGYYQIRGPLHGIPETLAEHEDIPPHLRSAMMASHAADKELEKPSDEKMEESVYMGTLNADHAEVVTLSNGTSPSTPLSPKSPKDKETKEVENIFIHPSSASATIGKLPSDEGITHFKDTQEDLEESPYMANFEIRKEKPDHILHLDEKGVDDSKEKTDTEKPSAHEAMRDQKHEDQIVATEKMSSDDHLTKEKSHLDEDHLTKKIHPEDDYLTKGKIYSDEDHLTKEKIHPDKDMFSITGKDAPVKVGSKDDVELKEEKLEPYGETKDFMGTSSGITQESHTLKEESHILTQESHAQPDVVDVKETKQGIEEEPIDPFHFRADQEVQHSKDTFKDKSVASQMQKSDYKTDEFFRTGESSHDGMECHLEKSNVRDDPDIFHVKHDLPEFAEQSFDKTHQSKLSSHLYQDIEYEKDSVHDKSKDKFGQSDFSAEPDVPQEKRVYEVDQPYFRTEQESMYASDSVPETLKSQISQSGVQEAKEMAPSIDDVPGKQDSKIEHVVPGKEDSKIEHVDGRSTHETSHSKDDRSKLGMSHWEDEALQEKPKTLFEQRDVKAEIHTKDFVHDEQHDASDSDLEEDHVRHRDHATTSSDKPKSSDRISGFRDDHDFEAFGVTKDGVHSAFESTSPVPPELDFRSPPLYESTLFSKAPVDPMTLSMYDETTATREDSTKEDPMTQSFYDSTTATKEDSPGAEADHDRFFVLPAESQIRAGKTGTSQLHDAKAMDDFASTHTKHEERHPAEAAVMGVATPDIIDVDVQHAQDPKAAKDPDLGAQASKAQASKTEDSHPKDIAPPQKLDQASKSDILPHIYDSGKEYDGYYEAPVPPDYVETPSPLPLASPLPLQQPGLDILSGIEPKPAAQEPVALSLKESISLDEKDKEELVDEYQSSSPYYQDSYSPEERFAEDSPLPPRSSGYSPDMTGHLAGDANVGRLRSETFVGEAAPQSAYYPVEDEDHVRPSNEQFKSPGDAASPMHSGSYVSADEDTEDELKGDADSESPYHRPLQAHLLRHKEPAATDSSDDSDADVARRRAERYYDVHVQGGDAAGGLGSYWEQERQPPEEAAEAWEPSRGLATGDFAPRGATPDYAAYHPAAYPAGASSSDSSPPTSPELSPRGFEMDSPEVRHAPFRFAKARGERRREGPESPGGGASLSSPSTDERSGDAKPASNPFDDWGEPMGLPSPTPPQADDAKNKGRQAPPPKKQAPKKNAASPKANGENRDKKPQGAAASPKRAPKASPAKTTRPESPRIGAAAAARAPVYVDLTYIPHHGHPHYCDAEFFRAVRARHYVFSGTNPGKEVFNALLEAKQGWDDPQLEVTIIPTYDTDTLGYWFALNEDELARNKIDLAPSASRCTINLQDHETSCSAYRLEF